MTTTWCRTCEKTVHITHDSDECEGEPDLRVPDELRKPHPPEPDEPAKDPIGMY